MSGNERLVWSCDPFQQNMHIPDEYRVTVIARLAREDDADELADELGLA